MNPLKSVILLLLMSQKLNKYFLLKIVPTPGVEPGPSGWKPDILTVRPRGMDALKWKSINKNVKYLQIIASWTKIFPNLAVNLWFPLVKTAF